MRLTRLTKFRKLRYIRIRNRLLYFFLLPTTLIFVGYLISSVLILPSINK